jgi:hypothetical protein
MRSRIQLTVNSGQLTMEGLIFVNCILVIVNFLHFLR